MKLIILIILVSCILREATFTSAQVGISEAQKEQKMINALKSNKKTYTIEIFVFVDHASYKRWFELSGNDGPKTLSAIKLYFVHVVNEVRRIYEQISLSGIWITCALVGYYIEDSPSPNFMYEALKGQETIDGTYAAELFNKWILQTQKSNQQIVTKFDVAILFTGLDFSVGNSYGNVGSACTTKGISIVRDGDFFSTAYATAQRIANNFGVITDGLSGCSDAESFIMSGDCEGGKNINNFFRFSKCSRAAFIKYFNILNKQNKNCLLNSPARTNPEVNQQVNEYPGMEYSHDMQCHIAFTPHSFKCPDADIFGDSFCAGYTCWNYKKLECSKVVPADGTPCDDKKWCFRKKCVPDKRAPSLDVNCPFGDFGGVIETDKGSLKCPQIAEYPEYCTNEFYKATYCCKSCSSYVDETPTIDDEDESNKHFDGDKRLHTVEVFVLVDHASYKKWFQLCDEDSEKTSSTIKLYFAHVINEARRVYEEVDMPGVRMSCSLVGYYIEETPSHLNFMKDVILENDVINDTHAAEMLHKWIEKDRKSENRVIPDFDVLMLFTGHNMLTGDGYGYLETACTAAGISIVRDTNFFFTTHTAIHEIGHNLGMNHDGAIGCSDDASYVMSATKLGRNITNLYKFSSCSISALSKYLNKLNRKKQNCLLNRPSRESQESLPQLKDYPGMDFTHDDQCRIDYGSRSSMCLDKQNYGDKMCTNTYCWNPKESTCSWLTLADGTPCDDKKWCLRRKCVHDNNAPSLDVNCRFGDYGGVINTDRGYLSCPQIATYPGYCENEFYKSIYCCKSCSSAVNPTLKEDVVQDNKANDDVSCNEPDWCAGDSFINCYEDEDLCCKTCKKKLDASRPDCKYGDHFSWCKEHTKSRNVCKNQDIKRDCCQSCQ